MKAITFLGATTAHETTYRMPDGREHTAPYFGVALARFYPDLQMRVFVTPKAREMHYERFQEQVSDFVDNLEAVDIPEGADQSQLWEILEKAIDVVDDEEEVIFDITHGFRSLPFLSFLAAAYLRVVKRIHLKAVLYGNYEARDKNVEPNRAPVIDLTPFVSLMDWMMAAERFRRFGEAHDLAYLLRQAGRDLHPVPAPLREAIRAIGDVSQALRLIRPLDAMNASAKLQTCLPDATALLPTAARPFFPLAHHISDAYAPLALSAEQAATSPLDVLAYERKMVHWFIEREQYIQAVALAYEWIVSWTMVHLGMPDHLDRANRERVGRELGNIIQQQKNKTRPPQNQVDGAGLLDHVPNIDDVARLYNQLGQVRNDLMHAGHRRGAMPANTLEKNICKYCDRLDELVLPRPTHASGTEQ